MATSTQYLQGAGGIPLQGSAPRLQGSPNTIQVGQAPTSGTIQVGNATGAVNQGQGYLQQAQAENSRMQSQIQSLLASLRPAAPAKVDIAAINAQARAQAESAVNPRYTKELNDMLARQAVKRSREQQDYSTGVGELDANLQRALEQSALTRTRVGEDYATNVGQINTAEDRFQTQTGQEFDDARLAQAQQLAAAGLTTSGIGRQQVRKTTEQQNVAEQQQTEDLQAQRTSEAIRKARNFEDLATSDILAGEKTEKGKQSAKLSLDRILEDLDFEEQQSRIDNESRRLADIAQQTTGYSQLGFNNYLASIRDPRVLEATARAYGGLF